jgi:hypothetical protein
MLIRLLEYTITTDPLLTWSEQNNLAEEKAAKTKQHRLYSMTWFNFCLQSDQEQGKFHLRELARYSDVSATK